jgi:hypothetical protein
MAIAGCSSRRALRMPAPPPVAVEASAGAWWRALDVVMGYQASWLLMFADYPRYSRSRGASARAVFLGLALPALWLMPLGFVVSRAAGTYDPGAMIAATGVGRAGAVLVVLATVTTNFVNIYMSALAWRSLAVDPRRRPSGPSGSGDCGRPAVAATARRVRVFMILLGGSSCRRHSHRHFVVLPRLWPSMRPSTYQPTTNAAACRVAGRRPRPGRPAPRVLRPRVRAALVALAVADCLSRHHGEELRHVVDPVRDG